MQNHAYKIDLQDYTVNGVKNFNTRTWGIYVRNASKIDAIESENEQIVIEIPADVSNINASFLEEFLENVVVKLGSEGFRRRFTFESAGNYKIENHLEEAISRILKEESVYA